LVGVAVNSASAADAVLRWIRDYKATTMRSVTPEKKSVRRDAEGARKPHAPALPKQCHKTIPKISETRRCC
jgi:hypothetical protein